jgi:hypothetical protein
VVGVVFIAPNHFLAVAPFSANRGRSAPLVWTVRPCTSTAEIPTVSSNGYNALNVSSDVRYRSRGWSGRAPRTIREDAIIHFIEPVTFGFFGSSPTGWSVLGLGRCLLFNRTVRSVYLCFCIGSVRGSP